MNQTKFLDYNVSYLNHQEFLSIKKEILSEGIYDIEISNPKPTIVDVGAHIGLATLYFKNKWPESKIISVEPNPQLSEILQGNIVSNSLPGIETINKAVGSKSGTVDFYIDDSEDMWFSNGSIYPNGWTGNIKNKKIRVETISLQEIVANNQVDLLKLDIEGSEYGILKSSQDSLKNINNIIVEFHPIEGRSPKKLIKLLLTYYKKVVCYSDGKSINQSECSGLMIIKAQK